MTVERGSGAGRQDDRPRSLVRGLLLLGAILSLGGFAGFLVEEAHRRRPVAAVGLPARPVGISSPAPAPTTAPSTEARKSGAPPRELKPWEATKENSPPVPKGHIPAWQVNPPPPPPPSPPWPPPREPPDPQIHRPPMHNPGGVDGDRPPRPVPGVP